MCYYSGNIAIEEQNIVPYPLRRSGGEIQLVIYEPSNIMMMHDYNFVMERNIAPRNTSNITVIVREEATVTVYGEMFGGYTFQAPTMIEMNGVLNIAYWTSDGLAEEPLNCNTLIEVTVGQTSLYVCDHKQIVIMYNPETKYMINLLQEKGEQTSKDQGIESGGIGKSAEAAKILNRVCSTAQTIRTNM